MRFEVLGPLAVWSSDGTRIAIPGVKVRALLVDLLIHEGRPVSSDQLIEDLWGADLPGKPTGALQTKVSQLRRALDTAEPGSRDLVELQASGYVLRVEADRTDAGQFTALTARARHESDLRDRAALLVEALGLWRGPACADVAYEDFAQGAIVRLAEQWLVALEDLAETRLQLGEHTMVAAELGDLVVEHPLRERLRASQMLALYGSGRQTEALDVYEELRCRLLDELGLDPGPELVELHHAILRQDPKLLPESVPTTSIARPVTNLPHAISTGVDGGLVGRAEMIERVRAGFDSSRLVTLTGPGGVGKTSIAVHAARTLTGDRVDSRWADGGWIVELDGFSLVDDGQDDIGGHGSGRHGASPAAVDAIAAVVAVVLGIYEGSSPGLPEASDRPGMSNRLLSALRSKRMLLVLDGCERMVESVARLTGSMLAAAPGLGVLVTSREPLSLVGEITLSVPPLDLPEPDATLDDIEQSGAVRLFLERATAARPGFTLGPDTAEAVVDVCRRLDGIPLALELAAARTPTLDVRDLSRRLNDRFALLAVGRHTGPERHRTLRATIDWSWDPLTTGERTVLCQLAVHAGGSSLDSVEAIQARRDGDAGEVADVLARLVDRSLVTVVDDGSARRYRLLESVAAYCMEQLDTTGETASARRLHAEHYAALAERAERRLRGHGQREQLRVLDTEAANLRVALDSAAHLQMPRLALRLVNSLGWYWFLRGQHQQARASLTVAIETAGAPPPGRHVLAEAHAEAQAWLCGLALTDRHIDDPASRSAAILQLYDDLDDPSGRAHAQWLHAFRMLGAGDMATGEQLVSDALAGFRQLGDQWGIAAALSTRAEHALVRGDLTTVRRDGEDSLRLFTELGDRWGQVQSMRLLATLAEIDGDYELAAGLHRSAFRIAEELGLWPSVSTQLASLGRIALLTGNIADATEYHRRARRLAEEQSDGAGVAFAVTGLALLARRQGELDLAEEHLGHLLDWNHRTGYQPGLALVLAELGFVAEQRGDADAAVELHTRALTAARATGDLRAVALALEGLAGAATLTGAHHRAARLLGAASAARASLGAPLPPPERGDIDRIAHRARAALGVSDFAAEHRLGGDTSIDELP